MRKAYYIYQYLLSLDATFMCHPIGSYDNRILGQNVDLKLKFLPSCFNYNLYCRKMKRNRGCYFGGNNLMQIMER